MTVEELLEAAKDRWNQLTGLSVALVSALTGFVVAPPATEVEVAHVSLGHFVVAVVVGLWLLPMSRWRSRRFAWYWWAAGLVSLVLTVAAVLAYQGARRDLTFSYFGERRIKGSHLLPAAAAFSEQRGRTGIVVNDSTLLFAAAGLPEQVWPAAELSDSEHRLLIDYLFTVLLGASTIIIITQATFCAVRQKQTPSGS